MPGRASAMVPPHDIPDGKKSIDRPALRSAHRDARYVSTTTSAGKRITRPVTPQRNDRVSASDAVATSTFPLNAAGRTAFRRAADFPPKHLKLCRAGRVGTPGTVIVLT